MKKRILSILLCCVMLVGLLPTVALAEGGVSYLDETGTSQTCDSATEVTSSDTEWTTGWYVVQGTVEIGSRVTVSGDVHLILTDGCTLTVNGGIQVQDNDNNPDTPSTNALTIYGQANGTGKLTTRYVAINDAAIGGNGVLNEAGGSGGSGGAITINGGIVEANSYYGAGIGGGGIIRMTDGNVQRGDTGGSGGKITINSGTVTATGNNGGAGIGGGYGANGGSGGTITINGGTVTATSTDSGAAIGGGEGIFTGGSGETITINGGYVEASNQIGAGIGGGEGGVDGGSGGEITINGGSVIATGGSGAGIGGGQGDGYSGGGIGGNITINGGTVTATSTGSGAGIGGGYSGGGGTGGDGGKITITGGNTTARGYYCTAIGGGFGDDGGSGGEVTITGGTVTATGNASGQTFSSSAAGIGGGRYNFSSGSAGTFQTNNGNAVIFASSIGDQSHKDDWSGIIFEGDEGKVYGNPTLADDLTIPENKALDIPSGKTLTVNSTITVQGTLTNNGTIIGSGSITPEEKKLTYKAAPSTPVIVSVSADSITLQPIVGETAVEYSKDNTKWQSETTFSGLTAATSYTFYARYQENGFYKDPSPQSDGSDPAYTAYTAPDTNGGYFIDYAAETITVSDGYEVNTDSGFGTGTVVTSGSTVTPGQTFHVRKAASGDIPASEGTEFTIPARPDAPAAPTVKSKTSGSVTLEVILGAQYSMDGGATWQDSPEFTGLSASTAYRFVARYGATESRFASLASAELNVTTNAALSGGGYTYYTIKKATPKLNTYDHFAYVQGYPDGTVKPAGNITRAETAAILFRLMDDASRKTYYSTKSGFRDVASGSWYNTYVATLNNAGVITDSSNGYFRPNEAITRAELAAMLAKFSETTGAANYFNDVSAKYWAANAIAICAKLGWITGYPDGTFRPDKNVTRAELMAMINRATGRAPKSADAFLPGMKTWSDNTTDKWYYLDVQEATNSHSYTVKGSETWTALTSDPNWSLYE